MFGEDLNEDGGIGLSAALSVVETDTFGVKLKRDEDKNLYIDLGDVDSEIIAITMNGAVRLGLTIRILG